MIDLSYEKSCSSDPNLCPLIQAYSSGEKRKKVTKENGVEKVKINARREVFKVTCVGRMRKALLSHMIPSSSGTPQGIFDLAGDGGNGGAATGTERRSSNMYC